MLRRKGVIGVGVVMSAVLGILVLGLAVGLISPGGSFFESIAEGLGLVDQQIGSTITVEDKGDIPAERVLSDAAMYVSHRASNNGCSTPEGLVSLQNNGRLSSPQGTDTTGYPGLEDTYLGLKPPCAGLSGSPASDLKNTGGVYDTGEDMEGVFSRVEFKIPENYEGRIVLGDDKILGEGSEATWLDNHILAASNKGFYERVASKEQCSEHWINKNHICSLFGRAQTACTLASVHPSGTKSDFAVYFKSDINGGIESRTTLPMDSELENSVYCAMTASASGSDIIGGAPVTSFRNKDARITLCPGDEGYIQVNKGKDPHNNGEAQEEGDADAKKYPFIQITQTGDSDKCENIEVEPEGSAKTNGRLLMINSDAEAGYFTLKKTQNIISGADNIDGSRVTFNFFDTDLHLNFADDAGDMSINPYYSGLCYIGLFDEDSATSEDGHVAYMPGTVIEKGGTFPDLDSDYVLDHSFEEANLEGSEKSVSDIYSNMVSKGFTGEKIKKKNSEILYGTGDSNAYFKLYGDIACGDPDGDGEAKWYMCHNNPEFETVSGYECSEETNSWDGSGTIQAPQPVTGIVTNDIMLEATGDNSDVVTSAGSGFDFKPGNSPSFSDYLVWQPLPEGDKAVEIDVEFQERGHLQIDAQTSAGEEASDTVTYINTHKNGQESVYIQKPSGTYEDTGFDYSTGTEYTISLTRSGDQIEWKISQGDTEKWSFTENADDFRRLVFESSESFTSPELTVKRVEVNQN